MKKYSWLLLFLPFAMYSQKEIVLDSVSLQAVFADTLRVGFNEHHYTMWDNGESQNIVKWVGDSATTYDYFVNRNIEDVRIFSYYATKVLNKKDLLHSLNNDSDAAQDVGLPDVLDGIREKFREMYLGNCRVKAGSADYVTGEIVELKSGVIRLELSGSNYRMTIFADTMFRLVGYPDAGQSTDFYRVKEGVYMDINKDYIIRLK
jgi:hypothetical protein